MLYCGWGGLFGILPSSPSVIWLVCYLCNQAEDMRGQGNGRHPNITSICHLCCENLSDCCRLTLLKHTVLHEDLTALILGLLE